LKFVFLSRPHLLRQSRVMGLVTVVKEVLSTLLLESQDSHSVFHHEPCSLREIIRRLAYYLILYQFRLQISLVSG